MSTPTSFIPPNQARNWESATSPIRPGRAKASTAGPQPVATPLGEASAVGAEQVQVGPSTWGTQSRRRETPPIQTVTGLNKWEGKILSVEGESFTAELYALDREAMPITADFDLELLGSDSASVAPGDVFYLSVRTVKSRGMRPTVTESLRLRRLGRITHRDVQDVYAKADALMEHLEQLFD